MSDYHLKLLKWSSLFLCCRKTHPECLKRLFKHSISIWMETFAVKKKIMGTLKPNT